MKDLLIPIDMAGRVVLPNQVREKLSINPGDLLQVKIQGDQVMLRPKREKAGATPALYARAHDLPNRSMHAFPRFC